MKYNIGDKVWISVADEEDELYYCGPATVEILLAAPGENYNPKQIGVSIPIEIENFGNGFYVDEREIKYKL